MKRQPLSGLRVLVGRARHQASALSDQLRKRGAEVIEIPFIEIRQPKSFKPLDTALKNLASYDWLILTSANGVDAMWARMKKLKLDRESVREERGFSRADKRKNLKEALAQGLRIAAIGPATQKAIEKRGWKVDIVPKEYVAESVVCSMRRRVKGKRVLLVRAKVARDVIPRELRKAGAQVDVVEAYETVVPESSRRRLQAVLKNPRRRPHVVTFTSSSTAKNFVALLRKHRPEFDDVKFASIGPVTSTTMREVGLRADIEAKEYTIPGLIEAIAETYSLIPTAEMRTNLRMRKLLNGIKFPKRLVSRLKKILDAGFVQKGGCLLLASEPKRSFGGESLNPIGYECLVNHIHVADFSQAWLYANSLVKAISLAGVGECKVIVSFDGKDATIRFHKVRRGQSWLTEDLEGYQEEAIAVLRSS